MHHVLKWKIISFCLLRLWVVGEGFDKSRVLEGTSSFFYVYWWFLYFFPFTPQFEIYIKKLQ